MYRSLSFRVYVQNRLLRNFYIYAFLTIRMLYKNLRAQGTIEYLVIIGVVAVIALFVVGMSLSFISTSSGVDSKVNKITTQSSVISVTDSSVTSDGNYLLRIENHDFENYTITNVSLADSNEDYSQQLFQGQAENFIINTSNICTVGEQVEKRMTITYTTKYGITKTLTSDILFNCENYNADETANSATFSCVGSTPENAMLCSGDDSDLEKNTDISLVSSCTDTKCEYYCNIGYNLSESVCEAAQIFLTTDTNSFLNAENLYANIRGKADENTYSYKWYKDGDLNATSLFTNQLVSYWSLNNDMNDYWGINHGYCTGINCPTSVTGKIGNAYNFPGDTNRIDVPTMDGSPNLDSVVGHGTSRIETYPFTVSVWFKPDETIDSDDTTSYFLYKAGDAFGIVFNYTWDNVIGVPINQPGKVMSYIHNYMSYIHNYPPQAQSNAISTTDTWEADTWYHVVAVWTLTSNKIYVNGEFEGEDAFALPPKNFWEVTTHQIGYNFDGDIDEVMVFYRALPADEIKMLYEGSRYGGSTLSSDLTSIDEEWKVGYSENPTGGSANWTDDQNSTIITIT